MEFRISRIQFLNLMFWLIMGTGILSGPLLISQFTVRDGWISALFFMVGASLSAVIVKIFSNSFPSRTLSEALIDALGPWGGRALNFWFLLWLCIQTAFMARQFLIFVENTILPRTPLAFIAGVFFVPVAYSLFLGLEITARFTEFLMPIALATGVIIGILVIETMHPVFLLPILGDGWSPVLRGGMETTFALAVQLIISLEILPRLQYKNLAARDVLFAGIIITLVMTLIQFVVISELGLTSNYLQYPILEVVRGIRIGKFVQRFDTLYVLGIISGIFIKVALYQYCFTSSLKTFVGFSSIRVLALGAVSVTGAASIFLWPDSVELAHYTVFVTPGYFSFTLITLPLIAVFVKRFRKETKNVIG